MAAYRAPAVAAACGRSHERSSVVSYTLGFLRRRPLRWTAVTTTAVVGLVLGTSGIAFAATGTVNTAGSPLTVLAAPGTSYTAWTSVSDAYGRTGSDGYVEHRCVYAGRPPRDNPHIVNSAISWEFARLGSTAYENQCLHFQAEAFGWSYSGFATAEAAGDWMVNNSYMHTSGIPPRGALVWYHNSSGTGHVVVSLGEGKIIGTSVGGDVGVASYTYHSSYRGWTVPYFPKAG